MIPKYMKEAPEVIISEGRLASVERILRRLDESGYGRLIDTLANSIPGGGQIREERANVVTDWASGRPAGSLVIDFILPIDGSEVIFALELRRIESLKTDWGRRHHGKRAGYLVAYGFGSTEHAQEHFSRFRIDLANAIMHEFKLKNPPTLASINLTNDLFKRLQDCPHIALDLSDSLIPVLHLMQDGPFRSTIIRTRQAKDPTIENIAKSTGMLQSEIQPLLQAGVDVGVVVKQHNVTCLSCSATLARVVDLDALAQMQRSRVACPECQTAVSAESFADCYLINEPFGQLLDGSRWMELALRSRLDAYLGDARVLTGVRDGPNELDLVANIDGSILLAELKDSRFSIGHAYSFVGKCSQYRPDISMIVATEGIDGDVKEYIGNTDIETTYVENLGELDFEIENVLSKQNGKRLAQLMSDIPFNAYVARSVLQSLGESLPIPDDSFSRFALAREFRSMIS